MITKSPIPFPISKESYPWGSWSGINHSPQFDLTRAWAYRAIRPHWGGPQRAWDADVLAYAWQHNETVIANDFKRGPLAYTEVQHLAQSIARWTWRNMTRKSFSARQRAIGKRGAMRSAEIRRAKAKAAWEGLA